MEPVLAAMHACSHPGWNKLQLLCQRCFLFAKSPKAIIRDVVGRCTVCQACKASDRASSDNLDDFPVPAHAFASLSDDFVKLDAVKVGGGTFD